MHTTVITRSLINSKTIVDALDSLRYYLYFVSRFNLFLEKLEKWWIWIEERRKKKGFVLVDPWIFIFSLNLFSKFCIALQSWESSEYKSEWRKKKKNFSVIKFLNLRIHYVYITLRVTISLSEKNLWCLKRMILKLTKHKFNVKNLNINIISKIFIFKILLFNIYYFNTI